MCQLIILLPTILSNIFAMAGGYDTRRQRELSAFFSRPRREAAFLKQFIYIQNSGVWTFKLFPATTRFWYNQNCGTIHMSKFGNVLQLRGKILWPKQVILSCWRFVGGKLLYQCLKKSHTTLWCPSETVYKCLLDLSTPNIVYIYTQEKRLHKSRCSRHRGMNSTETNLRARLINWNPYTEATSLAVKGTPYLGPFRILSRWRSSEGKCLLNFRIFFIPLFPRPKMRFHRRPRHWISRPSSFPSFPKEWITKFWYFCNIAASHRLTMHCQPLTPHPHTERFPAPHLSHLALMTSMT